MTDATFWLGRDGADTLPRYAGYTGTEGVTFTAEQIARAARKAEGLMHGMAVEAAWDALEAADRERR